MDLQGRQLRHFHFTAHLNEGILLENLLPLEQILSFKSNPAFIQKGLLVHVK